jgi:hypothetical protein
MGAATATTVLSPTRIGRATHRRDRQPDRAGAGPDPHREDQRAVLIRQNAIDRTSERRDHLELQINLLAEQEASRSLDMLQRIADHLQVPNARAAQGEELAEDTAVDTIARDLRAREKSKSKAL